MAKSEKMDVEVRLKVQQSLRLFYARPRDEPPACVPWSRRQDAKLGWCVAEVEVGPKGAKWRSSLYEPALQRMADGDESVDIVGMTKAQALREAKLWNENEKESKRPLRRLKK